MPGGMASVKEAEKGKIESTTDMHSAAWSKICEASPEKMP